MVEDGVYYEFYGNYAALFRGWFIAYALLILLPVAYFGRKFVAHLSLARQAAFGVPVMAVLAAVPFALAAESYFAYQEFLHLCRTEAALKVYQPMPEHVPGFAIDFGDIMSADGQSKCSDTCRIALVHHGYDFVEQISARGSSASDRGVDRFFLTPVGENGCTEERSVPVFWGPPGPRPRFCIDHDTDSEIRSDRKLEMNITLQAGCCRFEVILSSLSVPSGRRIAQAGIYRFALAPYLNFFGSVSWGRAVARFDRCTTHIEYEVKIDSLVVAVVGFPRGRSL